MIDPYNVLGITSNASDDEIKKTYRALSRKYHPDANINNPDKDQAETKFKEVQQAYQQIMHEREYGTPYESSSGQSGGFGDFGGFGGFGGFGDFGNFRGFSGQYQQTGNSGSESEEDLHMRAAYNFINSHHYKEALNLLRGIHSRNAPWYYYNALANSGLGNNVAALENAQEALRMEPGNMQYQTLVNRFESGESWYQTQQGPYSTTFTGGNGWCLKLCIANIVCNLCFGGGGMCCGGGSPGSYI